MNKRTSMLDAIERGKSDEWSKLRGGFTVFRMSNGTIDYFPYGQSANVHGERDSGAEVLARFSWNHTRWSRSQ